MNLRTLSLAALLVTPVVATAGPKEDLMALGKTNYMLCGSCHGVDGAGVAAGPDMKMAAPYTESDIARLSPELMALVVLKGIAPENPPKYLGQMAALGAAFDDTKLAAVITYVRNEFLEIDEMTTPEEVAGWREKYADVPMSITREELDERLAEMTGEEEEGEDAAGEEDAADDEEAAE